MAIATKRDLVGRTIVSVDFRRFPTGREGERLDGMDPIIELDNGRRIWIITQETESLAYGHQLHISNYVLKPKEAK